MNEIEIKFDREEILTLYDCILDVFKRGVINICNNNDDYIYVYSKVDTLKMLQCKLVEALDRRE